MAKTPCEQLIRGELGRKYANVMSDEAATYLAKIDPTDREQLDAFVRFVDRPRFRELAHEYWIASILSGPWTHMRNMVGNAAYAITEGGPTRALAGGIDLVHSLATGKPRQQYASESLPFLFGWTRGAPVGVAKALRSLGADVFPQQAARYGGLEEATTSLTQVGGALSRRRGAWERASGWQDLLPSPVRGLLPPPKAGGGAPTRAVGKALTLPLHALGAEDLGFKTMAYVGELHALAWREALKGGKRLGGEGFLDDVTRLIADPTEDMVTAANARAAQLTFTDMPSWFARQLTQLREADPSLLARGIVPFINTPDRLFVRGFEYTPIGIARSLATLGKAEGAGKGARASLQMREQMDPEMMARGMIGTMMGLGIVGLYHQGRITAQGAPPRNVGAREAMYAQNLEPYSLELGQRDAGGVVIPLSRLDPLGLPFGLAVAAATAQNEEDGAQAAMEFVSQTMQLGLEKGYLTTVGDLFDLASGYGDADRVHRFMVRQLGGLQPYSGASRQLATSMDPRVVVPETIGQQFQSQIPPLPGIPSREDLPARLDPLGREARYSETALPAPLAPAGTPLAFRPAATEPVYRELLRLGIRPAGTQETRQRRASEDVERKLRAYMASDAYRRSSDAARKRRVEGILAGR